MIAYLNYVAKAVVPWVVLGAAYVADLATQWTDVAADDTVTPIEWQTLVIAAVTSLGIFLKANGPKPE